LLQRFNVNLKVKFAIE